MTGTTTAAPTRLEILEDALKQARLRGAVKYGFNMYEVPGHDEPQEPYTGDLLVDADTRSRVCGVCLAGSVYLAYLERGIDPYSPEVRKPFTQATGDTNRFSAIFSYLEPFGQQAAKELALSEDASESVFSTAIEEGGLPYIERALELAIASERASLQ